MSGAESFVAGLIAMGYAIAGLMFLSFWRRTRDFLFGAFAIAFWLMALNQGLAALLPIRQEEKSPIYLLRLAAFVLIIAAVLRKNLDRSAPGTGE